MTTDIDEIERLLAAATPDPAPRSLRELDERGYARRAFGNAMIEASPAMLTEIRELRAENARLRIKWAELHNTCNVVGSPYDEALQAVDRLVCHVRTFARAALTGEPQ